MSVKRSAFSTLTGFYAARNLFAWTPSAEGGSVTDISGMRYHVFSTTGNNTFSVFSLAIPIEVALIAGGGGGGDGGGGGAGGLITWQEVDATRGNYTISVGAAGGTRASGSNSTGFGFTAVGGGGGPVVNGGASSGGSGSGGPYTSTSNPGYLGGAAGTSGQGNAGGSSLNNVNLRTGGGGGGYSGNGGDGGGGNGGNGGASISVSSALGSDAASLSIFSGKGNICGGGGGGGNGAGSGGAGTGATGAGNGGTNNGTSATMYGCGGGGCGYYGYTPGSGFQGLVIVRYSLT